MLRYFVGLTALLVCGLGAAQAEPGQLYGTVVTTDGRTFTGLIEWDDESRWSQRLGAEKLEQAEVDRGGFTLKLFGMEANLGGNERNQSVSLSVPFGHLHSIEPKSRRTAQLTFKNGESMEVRANTSELGPGLDNLVVVDAKRGSQTLTWRSVERVEFKAAPAAAQDKPSRRIYGTVSTAYGQHTGPILWDRDESMLGEILDGYEDGEEHELPFERIKSIEPLHRGSRVTLHDGSQMVLTDTNDVDEGHRGVRVEVAGLGSLTFEYEDVKKVDFSPEPQAPGYESFDGGKRLRGSVKLTDGSVLQGEIAWDQDELYSWETLDGDVDAVDYAILFSAIASIRPLEYESSEVILRDETVLTLSGSNDVDEDNRGVLVQPKDGEEVLVEWDRVSRVTFDW